MISAPIFRYMWITERYDEVTRILNYFITKCEQDNASFFIYSMFMEERIRCAAILKDQAGYLEYTKRFLEVAGAVIHLQSGSRRAGGECAQRAQAHHAYAKGDHRAE